MDTKERHIKENERREDPDTLAQSLTANGKNRKRQDTKKTNRLWLWLGVLILVFILLYWLFSVGIFADLTNSVNG